ncbi:MAG: PAS domain S-box protein [Myxococcota bacterium]
MLVNLVAFYMIVPVGLSGRSPRRADREILANRVSLEDLRALHENIVSSIQSGLITVNLNRQITFFNGVAEEITGYSAQRPVPRHHALLHRPEGHLPERRQAVDPDRGA